MPETGKSDRWKSLLDTLGVPVSEPVGPAPEPMATSASETPGESGSSAGARPQPISMLRPEKPKAAAKPKPAPPAAKSPSYWSRIAGALGLEAPTEPLEEPKIQRAEEPKVEPTPGETRTRSALDDIFGPTSVDPEVSRPIGRHQEPRMREAPVQRDPLEEERGPVREFGDDGGLDLPLGEAGERETRPQGEGGPEREGRRRRRRRGRRGRGEGREAAAPRREAEIEPAGEEVDLDYEQEVDLEAGPVEGAPPREERPHREQREAYPPRQEREERGRGGRRRRRGPPRGGRDEMERERPASYEPDEVEADLREERPATELRPARYEEELDEQDLGEHEEGDEEHAGGLPTHKKIPTWEEAVGILIETNMAARAASPDRDRGRGYGRGRGRGR